MCLALVSGLVPFLTEEKEEDLEDVKAEDGGVTNRFGIVSPPSGHVAHSRHGRAMQVEAMKPMLKAPGTKRLKL